MNGEPVLIAQGASRRFASGIQTVDACADVDLSVKPGEFVVVRGRSGAGKTTLLSLLAGLVRPTGGRVEALGLDLGSATETELTRLRRADIATIPQDFGLLGALTAAENVEVPLRLTREDPHERDRLVAHALDAVGLGHQAKQRPDQLSGGQQQRVAIARAIVRPRRIVLADEPTGSLDSATAATITDVLHGLARSGESAVVVTTHDPVVVARADRVLQMHDGRITEV
ncbi:ABC transporter ATP-binding protein [Rathayibacter sp. CAU 1779]